MYYSYVLRSISTGRHNFGSTEDLENRLRCHNSGKVRSSKAYIPYKIIFSEAFQTRSEAFNREMFYKSIDGRNWLKQQGVLFDLQ